MNQKSPWTSLVYIVLAYAVVVFLGSLLIETSFGVALVYVYAVFYPMIMLSGAWAVLGPGSYITRTLTSVSAVLAIFFAGMLAVILSTITTRPFFDMELSIFDLVLIIGCFGIPLIVAAQLPYWACRLVFGWQLVTETETPQPKRLDIKEMLGITAVLAIVLVAPSHAVSVLSKSFINQVQIGDTETEMLTDPNSGEVTFEDVVVDSENIEKYRAERATSVAQGQRIGLAMVLGYALAIAITTLINLPCFCLGMLVDETKNGFIWAIFYWLGIFFVLFIGVAVITQPPGNSLGEITLYFIFLCIIFALSASLPVYVARLNGAKLVGRRDFRNATPTEQLAKPAEVTDPFGD